MGNVSELYSGTFFDLDEPKVEQVHIKDIAHHLSMICRFAGGCSKFYSVAEHSVHVARVLLLDGQPWHVVFAGLMHDAHETYTSDLPTSFKNHVQPLYHTKVNQLDRVICKKFNIMFADMRSRPVKLADHLMLGVEAHWLMKSAGQGSHWEFLLKKPNDREISWFQPDCLCPEEAKHSFIHWFNRCQAKMMHDDRYLGFVPTYIR